MVRNFLLLSLLVGCLSSAAGCTGGCWLKADAVRAEPTTDCLTLFAGDSPTDDSVCAVPELKGVNNCSDALILPTDSASAATVAFAPGQNIGWLVPAQSVPPDIVVNNLGGGGTDYVITAMLGSQTITITIHVHQ